jgi:hypothetical protein
VESRALVTAESSRAATLASRPKRLARTTGPAMRMRTALSDPKAEIAVLPVSLSRDVRSCRWPPQTRYRDSGSESCWPATSLESEAAFGSAQPHSQPTAIPAPPSS